MQVSDLNNLDSEPHVIKSKHGAVNQVRVVPRFGEAAKIDELSAVSAAMSEKLAGAYLLLGYTDGTVQLLDPLVSDHLTRRIA